VPRLDAESSVVPVRLDISMVVEGFHGNRGLLPSSTRVRLLKWSLPSPRRTTSTTGAVGS